MNTLAAVLLLLWAPALATGAERARSTDPDKKEWTPLFDGKSLDGWTPKIAGYEVGVNYGDTFASRTGPEGRLRRTAPHLRRALRHLYKTPFSHYVVAVEYRFVGE
jgi:hypothetical protein